MSDTMFSTKEVAAYLGINEKQVYALIKAGRIPGTRVTGKWVFPKKLIDEWIETSARGGLQEAREKSRGMKGALLASGSNDPVLDFLLTGMRHSTPGLLLLLRQHGSTEGLKALGGGYTDIAWTHLLDPESGRYNVPFIPKYLPDMKAVLVHLFRREIGIVAAPGNPLIAGIEDIRGRQGRFGSSTARTARAREYSWITIGRLGIPADGYQRLRQGGLHPRRGRAVDPLGRGRRGHRHGRRLAAHGPSLHPRDPGKFRHGTGTVHLFQQGHPGPRGGLEIPRFPRAFRESRRLRFRGFGKDPLFEHLKEET